MIKKLWLKLVLLYTGITGLILALCLGITFFFSCSRYEASLDAQIRDQIESYQIKLLSSRQVDQSTLQELEENLDGKVYIFENGKPLFRSELTGGPTTNVLENIYRSEHNLSADELSKASNGWTAKKDKMKTSLGRFHVFYFRQEGKTQIEILALQNQSVRLPFIQHQAVFYGVLLLLGCIILAVINSWLIRSVLRPVENSVRQQKEFVAAAGHELKTPLEIGRASCRERV